MTEHVCAFRPGQYPEDWVPTFNELELLASFHEREAESLESRARALEGLEEADPKLLQLQARLNRRTVRVLRWCAARASRLHELNAAERRPARFGKAGAGGLQAIDGGRKG